MEKSTNLLIRKVAVLGAGVMGAQIAAHFASANVPVILFDLPGNQENRSSIVKHAIEGLQKLHPCPYTVAEKLALITPANYEDSLSLLRECDLVIEAISERLEWKEELYKKIVPAISANTLLVTNTSGLSINTLAETLPETLHPRFFGVHFFNPPGYMPLVEMIPSEYTDTHFMSELEPFLISILGKNIVYTKDTPNFIANRIGLFSMLITMHLAQQYEIELDIVDALTGPLIGRPKSATLRTADVVGLDTFAHAVSTMTDNLAEDPWHRFFKIPTWMSLLIKKGALGQKTQQGIFKKDEKQILVFTINEESYRPAIAKPNKQVIEILQNKVLHERLSLLRNSKLPEAQFLWSYFRELFHYSAFHLSTIAQTARDIDQAMRWGFGWQQGPFEIWQEADWKTITQFIQEDIDAKRSLIDVPLPQWVLDQADKAVYTADGSFSPEKKAFVPRRHLPVYEKQLFPELMPGESHRHTKTLVETDAVRLWQLTDETAVLSFKTKLGVIDNEVVDGILLAITKAIESVSGLILCPCPAENFSAGANLANFVENIKKRNFQAINDMLAGFQTACLALRYAPIPVVAAVQGYALGGGCELMLHCDAVVAALRSQIGLVEAKVGLLPAGGGCKEMAQRAAQYSPADPSTKLLQYFSAMVRAELAKNAHEAQKLDYLRDSDTVVFNPQELLFNANQRIKALNAQNYHPTLKAKIPVLGKPGVNLLMSKTTDLLEAGILSSHDITIANNIAQVLCGGDVVQGTELEETKLLQLEREHFIELCNTKETLARIETLLSTGKPLKN